MGSSDLAKIFAVAALSFAAAMFVVPYAVYRWKSANENTQPTIESFSRLAATEKAKQMDEQKKGMEWLASTCKGLNDGLPSELAARNITGFKAELVPSLGETVCKVSRRIDAAGPENFVSSFRTSERRDWGGGILDYKETLQKRIIEQLTLAEVDMLQKPAPAAPALAR